MKPVRALLFDLDGTLVQTREASWQLFRQTNELFGLGIDRQQDYFALFENNFFEAMHAHCKDPSTAQAAQAHFLELMRHDYLPPFVPGMLDVVRACAGQYALAIISSNALQAIRRITDMAGITQCFSQVFAGDVIQDKREAIRMVMTDPTYATRRRDLPWFEEREETALQADEVMMITDTVGDVRHARECGVRVVGVSWGLHSEKQLLEAGAEQVVYWPQELLSALSLPLAPGKEV
ncbi:phosphoglycolate phosphatase [Pseudomonas sp. NFACC02]|uniref:HAD family hydrolase n=1 Tax=Pseudomonas sp. NFACC02 TaxID=1566250 RepID=UPI0008CBF62D|nr:HAD hydrolase-like protein [Pseudomonas sp. NFACC02]SEQ48124.1 phosphoglycolate phosphatase [Pseudomonas sp. NFACC02]